MDTHVQEKPLSIALREINEDLLTCEDIDPEAEGDAADRGAEPPDAAGEPTQSTSRPRRRAPPGRRPASSSA